MTAHVRRVLMIGAVVIALPVLFVLSRWDYLVFHVFVELVIALVCIGTFNIAWNTRGISEHRYLDIVSVGMLFVGLTTILHMLVYKGMSTFPWLSVTPNAGSSFWIISRLIAGVAFVLAGIRLHRPISRRAVSAFFGVVWLLSVVAVFAGVFPVMFVEGSGPTPLKQVLELVVMALLWAGAWLLWNARKGLDAEIVQNLLVALVLMSVGELAFLITFDVYGIVSMTGHLLELASFVIIYRALIETSLTRPYEVLFRELTAREQQEARIADVLQSALVSTPDKIPGVECASAYQSATTGARVGGDFFELWTPAKGVVAFMLGDVSGKGVEAAASTALVRSIVRGYAYEDPTPGSVLRRCNQVLYRELPSDRFVTLVYGLMDLKARKVLLAGAGHPDPVVRFANGETAVVELPRQAPLGVKDDERFTSVTVDVEPGDMIVMMSDGVLDAGWRHGALGVHRAVSAIARVRDATPDSVSKALLRAAVQHAGEALSDDVSIMALRFTPVVTSRSPARTP